MAPEVTSDLLATPAMRPLEYQLSEEEEEEG